MITCSLSVLLLVLCCSWVQRATCGTFTFKDTIVGEEMSIRSGMFTTDDAPYVQDNDNGSYVLIKCTCHVCKIFFFSIVF